MMPEKDTGVHALEGGQVALRRLAQPSPAKPGAGPALGYDFMRVAEIVRLAAEKEYRRVPTLHLRCMIVSYAAFTVAREYGIECKIVGGWYVRNPFPAAALLEFGNPRSIALRSYRPVRERHCWVEHGQRIWDLTRTQFGSFPAAGTVHGAWTDDG